MKKLLILLSVSAIALTSCLKDKPNVDFSNIGTVAMLPGSGIQYFPGDAITSTAAIDTVPFTINIASDYAPSTPTSVTVGVNSALVATYDAYDTSVFYSPLPDSDYSFKTTTVSIPGGKRLDTLSVLFYTQKVDPSQSFLLPVAITAATNNGKSLIIASNESVHYYHFIGNVFAGTYLWDYTRTPASGNFTGGSATLSPITPTHLETYSGYYTGKARYEITFTQTGSGATATYSNFSVVLNSDDVTNIFTPNGITVTAPATFVSTGTSTALDNGKQYTAAQVKAMNLFDFTYSVVNSSGGRVVVDRFYH